MPRKKLTEEEEIARIKAMSEIEEGLRQNGYSAIAGVDEAGRGPLAGPVYAAAVILPEGCIIKGINDSKKLSEKSREELYNEITEKAVSYCVCAIDEKRIENIRMDLMIIESKESGINMFHGYST